VSVTYLATYRAEQRLAAALRVVATAERRAEAARARLSAVLRLIAQKGGA
jgi:hypothetical protein